MKFAGAMQTKAPRPDLPGAAGAITKIASGTIHKAQIGRVQIQKLLQRYPTQGRVHHKGVVGGQGGGVGSGGVVDHRIMAGLSGGAVAVNQHRAFQLPDLAVDVGGGVGLVFRHCDKGRCAEHISRGIPVAVDIGNTTLSHGLGQGCLPPQTVGCRDQAGDVTGVALEHAGILVVGRTVLVLGGNGN